MGHQGILDYGAIGLNIDGQTENILFIKADKGMGLLIPG